jgi:hypothetical protein
MQNEDTFFLQNLDENPKETGLPEYIMEIIQSEMKHIREMKHIPCTVRIHIQAKNSFKGD